MRGVQLQLVFNWVPMKWKSATHYGLRRLGEKTTRLFTLVLKNDVQPMQKILSLKTKKWHNLLALLSKQILHSWEQVTNDSHILSWPSCHTVVFSMTNEDQAVTNTIQSTLKTAAKKSNSLHMQPRVQFKHLCTPNSVKQNLRMHNCT